MSTPRPRPASRTCAQCYVAIDGLPASARRCTRCEGFSELAERLPRPHLALEGWQGLPPRIRERLAAEGVHDFDAWRALGPQRWRIFGVTPTMVRLIDGLARGALR